MFEEYKIFWSTVRQALLLLVDAIEREMSVPVTTAQMRNWYKMSHKQ